MELTLPSPKSARSGIDSADYQNLLFFGGTREGGLTCPLPAVGERAAPHTEEHVWVARLPDAVANGLVPCPGLQNWGVDLETVFRPPGKE